jgi:hypothetical protein
MLGRQGVIDLSSYVDHGAVAQLGERLNGIQEAGSSILLSSTLKGSSVMRALLLFPATMVKVGLAGPLRANALRLSRSAPLIEALEV